MNIKFSLVSHLHLVKKESIFMFVSLRENSFVTSSAMKSRVVTSTVYQLSLLMFLLTLPVFEARPALGPVDFSYEEINPPLRYNTRRDVSGCAVGSATRIFCERCAKTVDNVQVYIKCCNGVTQIRSWCDSFLNYNLNFK
ncbi:uncharacterized protein LOC143227182 [Tachypleus tridentatus]|uniref:uncharacterized protein LOC143227182 n=1 Tax=Tachypleus tridentatus TaxID=6853 RepID=UPI003FD05E5D